ncbi:hypothetical protein SNOG_05988 [Parastagonospora nodorum SN15]|uniref:Uncharacterized protein n=1 Tax=Phaeosphaeria nodorum (strain SN15 / ATCC MYA-4574 / FGSC 10173) TaxID=321614 RepID=Q0UQH6_PHANO|nr:hypothetical protein SNOG_05988 [Parastagonospora nodorum SN15]EAT87052.1 hypothetical protein SNOG_05988 [Parastagonospora nodorum SN15]
MSTYSIQFIPEKPSHFIVNSMVLNIPTPNRGP